MSLENFFQPNHVPIKKVQYAGLIFDILRLDKIHEGASGNKFFKLKYNFLAARQQGYSKILTYGGAFSNHIVSCAIAAKACGFESVGMIRGEEMENHSLKIAKNHGMTLHFLDREIYRQKHTTNMRATMKARFPDHFHIPEGGTNHLAMKGAIEIHNFIPDSYDLLCAPFGTGGTLAGLINGKKPHQHVLGISALKGGWVQDELQSLCPGKDCWRISADYSFGGYAKWKPELVEFMYDFYEKTQVPLDPVYTAKMVYGLLMEWKRGAITAEQNILLIHTGGLQGIVGFNERFGFVLPQE